MNLFPVYTLFDVEPIKGEGAYVYDSKGDTYLDLYGGHAVISIGHSHPHQVKLMKDQLDKMIFYSNSVVNSLQEKYASKLIKMSGYSDYSLFLCNSGTEANDHALKLAAFQTGRKKIISFNKGFHGRTGTSLQATHNKKISSPLNAYDHVTFLPFDDEKALENALKSEEYACIIIEPIQGVAGLFMPSDDFLKACRRLCSKYGTLLILDEVQSGFGRSGKFFAHQYANIKADIIPMAKGMGNGFPVGGLLISPEIQARKSMLGTTFGGNHLACAAATAVLDVIDSEGLLAHATEVGTYAKEKFSKIPGAQAIRGRGLMLGIVFDFPVKEIRTKLVYDEKIFTGSAADPNVLRILPPLNVTKEQIDFFVEKLTAILEKQQVHS